MLLQILLVQELYMSPEHICVPATHMMIVNYTHDDSQLQTHIVTNMTTVSHTHDNSQAHMITKVIVSYTHDDSQSQK